MDYYSILGVSKNASHDDIRKAYKKQSMQHHPDRGGDEEQFKKVNEAYQTLGDPKKRQAYDNPQPQFNYRANDFHGHNPFEDIFAGFGFRPQRQLRNRDIKLSHTIEFKDIFTGRGISVAYRLLSGRQEMLDLNIPAGLQDGDVINFAGYGDDSIPNAPRGNLILKIRIPKDTIWNRDGDNFTRTVKINVLDLLIGTEIEITTPQGKDLSLTVPQGTRPGTTFSIPGYGAPNVNTNRQGNLYVKIEGLVPKITDQHILTQIKNIRSML